MEKVYSNFFCVSAMVLWALGFPAKDVLLLTFDPIFVYALGLLLASLIALIIWIAYEGYIDLKSFPTFKCLLYGGFGFGAGGCIFIYAQSLSNAVTVAIAAAFMPIFGTMLEILFDNRVLKMQYIIGLIISIIGGIVMTFGFEDNSYYALGLLCSLPGVFLFAWGSREITKNLPNYSEIAQGSISIIGAALFVCVPYIIINYDFTYIPILKAMTFEQIFHVIIFAAFGISISQVLWIIGVSKLGIAMASIHMNSAPFYVMVFVFILGGSWVWIQFFALTLVVLGVFLTQFERLEI